jgi:hypothetical protein
MLTSDEISLLCQRLELSSQAQVVLANIRLSPPFSENEKWQHSQYGATSTS